MQIFQVPRMWSTATKETKKKVLVVSYCCAYVKITVTILGPSVNGGEQQQQDVEMMLLFEERNLPK